jgi:type II secretory pathway predicted ATPase ExeA
MYLQHFGLSDRPFRIVPSPRYFFLSETHDEGRARILYGIRENRGFVVVTGGVGLGKTTVLFSVVDDIIEEMDVAMIVNPIDSFDQLLRVICEDFGVTVRDTHADEATLLAHLNTVLLSSYAKGRGCVLMLDEAQNLSLEVLEKVRTLSNLQTEDASLLQIVLVGQPELTAKLNDHRLRQLRQRIGVWHEIRPFELTDTIDYIWHRLALSGAHDPRAIARRKSCQLIHELSQGIPRIINQLADTALVVAYGAGSRAMEVEHVHEAARELRLEDAPLHEPDYRPKHPRRVRSATEEGDRRRRRWLIAAVIVMVLVILTGAAWTRFGDTLGASLFASGPAEETESGPPPVAEILAGSIEVAATAFAEPRELSARAARILDGYRRVEELRAEGTVYAVHLGSFRTDPEARQFAQDLVASHPDWTRPLYVEKAGGDQVWYRVTADGFAERADAVVEARAMRAELGLLYAQLTRLNSDARALTLGSLRGAEVADNDE